MRQAIEVGNRYLLAGILGAYVVIIVVPRQVIGAPALITLLGTLVVMAVRRRRWAVPLAVLAAGATFGTALIGSERVLSAVTGGAIATLTGTAILAIGRTVVIAKTIDATAVRGVLCVYLLLALLFAGLHQLFGAFQTYYLNGVSGWPTASEALYFSVITLATVGYGDITPATDLARAVAVMEALVGQLYLVSVVAAVIARYRR